jgi:hypothetical protein
MIMHTSGFVKFEQIIEEIYGFFGNNKNWHDLK